MPIEHLHCHSPIACYKWETLWRKSGKYVAQNKVNNELLKLIAQIIRPSIVSDSALLSAYSSYVLL